MVWTRRLIMRHRVRRAICEYEKMVDDDSKNVRVRSRLADLYLKDHKVDRAIDQYTKVANHYEKEDLKSRAISVYKKILNLDPKRVVIYHRLADLYRGQGLLGTARTHYQQVVRLDPEDEPARKGISEIERAISEDKRDASESLAVPDSPHRQTVLTVSVMA